MPTDTDTGTDTDTDTDCGAGSWSLMVVDNDAIRRDLELELQSVREAIEGCEAKIERHETHDLPAFRQWMVVKCSDLLNERRVIEEKIWGLRARLAAIQGLTQHGIKHLAAAFFWFQEIQEASTVIPPYVRRAWEEVTVGGPKEKRGPGSEPGRFDEGSGDEDEADRGDGANSEISESLSDQSEVVSGDQGETARHKSLYRKIALLLHPDLAGVLTKQELELWYQAQRAYSEKDVVALEMILARCDRVGTNSLSLSELRICVRQANARLATLRQSIALLGEAPSWRFLWLSSAKAKVRLRDVRRELEGVIRGLAREAAMLENELARIEERAKRWARKRKEVGKQLALGF